MMAHVTSCWTVCLSWHLSMPTYARNEIRIPASGKKALSSVVEYIYVGHRSQLADVARACNRFPGIALEYKARD